MPKRKRSDTNQRSLVQVLEKLHCSVLDMSDVGGGVPDLLVAKGGRTCFAEVKHPGANLRDNQQAWHDTWRGVIFVIRTQQDCLVLHDYLATGAVPQELEHNQVKRLQRHAKNTDTPDVRPAAARLQQ